MKKSITQHGANTHKRAVYRHIRKDKSVPFCIVVGKDPNRPYSKRYRNKYLKNLRGHTHSDKTKLKNCLSQKNRMPVTINNINYPSLNATVKALVVHKNTIKKKFLGNGH